LLPFSYELTATLSLDLLLLTLLSSFGDCGAVPTPIITIIEFNGPTPSEDWILLDAETILLGFDFTLNWVYIEDEDFVVSLEKSELVS